MHPYFLFSFVRFFPTASKEQNIFCGMCSRNAISCLDCARALNRAADNVTYDVWAFRGQNACVTDKRASERASTIVVSSKRRRFLPSTGCTIVRSSKDDAPVAKKVLSRTREEEKEKEANDEGWRRVSSGLFAITSPSVRTMEKTEPI